MYRYKRLFLLIFVMVCVCPSSWVGLLLEIFISQH